MVFLNFLNFLNLILYIKINNLGVGGHLLNLP
jgi:hypothetical protein